MNQITPMCQSSLNMSQLDPVDYERLALTRKVIELSNKEAVLKKQIEDKNKCLHDVQYQLILSKKKLKSLRPSLMTRTKCSFSRLLRWFRGARQEMAEGCKVSRIISSLSSFLQRFRYRGNGKSKNKVAQTQGEQKEPIRSEELNPPMKPPLITINDEQWAAPIDINDSQKNLARVEPSPSFLDNLESRTSTTDGGEADSTFGSLYSDKVFYSDCKPSEPVEVLNIINVETKIPLFPSVGFLRDVANSQIDQDHEHQPSILQDDVDNSLLGVPTA